MHFIFNILEFPSHLGELRRGVCTGWLADLVAPVLQVNQKSKEFFSPQVLTFDKKLMFCKAESEKIIASILSTMVHGLVVAAIKYNLGSYVKILFY